MIAKRAYISVVNARLIHIDGDVEDNLEYEDGELISFVAENGTEKFTVRKGGILYVGSLKVPYLVYQLKLIKGSKSYITVETAPVTKATIFLTPMVFKHKSEIKYNNNFIGTFIDYEGSNTRIGINLLYRFSGHSDFSLFENSLQNNPYYVKTIDVDKFHVLYCFSIPDQFIIDYNLILNSKYSEISDYYKTKILSFNDFKQDGETYGILYKTKELRKRREEEFELPEGSLKNVELYDEFNIERETYWNKYNLIPNVVKTTV
jgi:hypothetical protein